MIKNLPEKIVFKTKITRICDICGDEKEVRHGDIMKIRKKHNRTLDYCFKCSMKIYNLR